MAAADGSIPSETFVTPTDLDDQQTARPFGMTSINVRGELATGDPCGRRETGPKRSSSVLLDREGNLHLAARYCVDPR